ncbi:MAG: DUF1080 domain-containing protein [Clostridia bacterium]|nr:DUF1080 domain-containing protein [Clostridia bacterium]
MTKKVIAFYKIVLIALMAVCLTLSIYGFTKKSPTVLAQGTPVSYSADFSNGLPFDWVEYNRSDVSHTKNPTTNNGNLILEHDITRTNDDAKPLYYGGMYKIAQSLGDLTDFTLSLTYRVLDFRDNSRWVGVMYHTNETNDGQISGYMMNYRVNGKSAGSVVQTGPTFNDFNIVENTGVAHDRTTFITLKIAVSGDTATHYVNDQVITTYNFSDKTDLLKVQKSGGLALIVNISKVEIKDLSITGYKVNGQTAYVADFSNGLPNDWAKNAKGAVEETSHQKVANGLQLTHAGSQDANNYYGGFYDIATNLTNATDFILEAKISMPSYENDARWFGIAYHKQENDLGYSSFYLMNYRQNGNSAYSTVTSAPKFNDEYTSETGLTQGENIYRTIRIVVKDKTAYHYIDNTLVQLIDLQSKESILGNTQTSGGFAILFNKCSIVIDYLWIKAEVLDETCPTTSSISNPALEFAPTIVTETDELLDITATTSKDFADSMIFELDANLNVVSNGAILTTLSTALKRTYTASLPIVRISNDDTKTAFLKYISDNDITDIAVISDNSALLKSIRTSDAGKNIRAILDWTNTTLNDKTDWQTVVNTTNACRANVALLSEKDATRQAVTYIQARLMTVWVKQDSYSSFSTHEIITTGAYGIVSAKPDKTYQDFLTYTDILPLVRTPYNIAHRGIPNDYAENSLYGYQMAYETGATHIEVDVHLTADGQLVVMHDDSIDRTTTGTGKVKNLTLSQIQQYKIDRVYNGSYLEEYAYEPIPSLAEVFGAFADKDIVYALEIKSYEDNVVEKLKELIATYNVKHQIFVISFKLNVIEQMRDVLPEIPSALLGAHIVSGNMTTAFTDNNNMFRAERYAQLASLATNLDSSNGEAFLTESLKHRGYMSFFWTYQKQEDIEKAFRQGCLGITNNKSQSLEPYARFLQAVPNEYIVSNIDDILANGLSMQYITYGDDSKSCTATVHAYNTSEYYTDAIFKYSFRSNTYNLVYTLYSESVRIINPEYFMSVQEINALLNASIESLTANDIPNIEKTKIAYQLLSESDKALIDIADADRLIEQLNTPMSYQLTLVFDNNKGTITGANDGDIFNFNDSVSLQISSKQGYVISSITVNGNAVNISSNKNTTVTFVVKQNSSVVVSFAVDNSTNNNSNSSFGCAMNLTADGTTLITLISLLILGVIILNKKRANKN